MTRRLAIFVAMAVRRWAATRPGFQEIWIDHDHNGWIAVGFDSDVERRQQEILEQFPLDGVVAVLVDWDLAELRRLQDEIGRHLVTEGVTSFAIGASTQQGLVQISLGVLTNDRLTALAPYVNEPICVEGLDPEGAILDGPSSKRATVGGSSRYKARGAIAASNQRLLRARRRHRVAS